MNINYQFADTLGSVYNNGHVKFLSNGYSVLSPIGNKLKLFQLKENLSSTLEVGAPRNIVAVALNSSSTYAMVVTEDGQCNYVNLTNNISLFSAHIGRERKIRCLAFSPNSKIIAICTGGYMKIVSLTNFSQGQFRPFRYLTTRRLSAEPINCVDWSADGRLLVCGGEDRAVRVLAPMPYQFNNVPACVMLPHERALVGTYFYGKDHYNIVCINRSGVATVFSATLRVGELRTTAEDELGQKIKKGGVVQPALRYERMHKLPIYECCDSAGSYCSAAACNRSTGLFVTGFSNGVFAICQLPELTVIQTFRAGELEINSLDLSANGAWLAIGCGRGLDSQLMIWEWESETYILKQQSHSDTITSACYSPDGSMLCTGAEDGKVKIWNCLNSFCVVTFTEHESGVTDVCFTQSGKAILSASMDGTVRAHDLKRYRNFRTMATPKQTQLHLLCTDSSGELVMAASRDTFEIYVWSLDTGNILDVITGHTDTICGISTNGSTLASVSMDKTLRVHNVVEGGHESAQLFSEGLDVKYSPCGHILAVLCYDSSISFFHTGTTTEIGSIETRLDVDAARESKDLIKKSTSEKNKSFTCIAFSPDSLLLLVGGQSNIFCLYSVAERLLLRQFRLSANLSLDGVQLDIDYRKLTEYGNIDLIEYSDGEEEAEQRKKSKKLKLPGTRHSNMAERSVNRAMRVTRIAFNPTGRSFCVVSTEGVSTYALDLQKKFDPFELESEIVPSRIRTLRDIGEYRKALCMALRLNDSEIVRETIELISPSQLKIVIPALKVVYAEQLLKWIASQNESVLATRLHFYQLLIRDLLYSHAARFKENLDKNLQSIVAIQQLLNQQSSQLVKLCNQNTYAMEYLLVAMKMNATSMVDGN